MKDAELDEKLHKFNARRDLFHVDQTAPRTAVEFETWLLARFPKLQLLFDDPPCLTPDARMHRVRALIVTRDLDHAIAGRRPADGKPETWAERYERIYEQGLYAKPLRLKP